MYALQEVLIDYGHSRSNLDLMCDYGFIVHGNGGDRVLSGELKGGDRVLSAGETKRA